MNYPRLRNLNKILFSTVLVVGAMAHAGDTKKSLEMLKSKLNKYGAPKVEGTEKVGDRSAPGLYFGTKKINNNFDSVDDVKKSMQGTATVFVKDGSDFVRVSTNVLKPDGTRAIGTTLDATKAAYAAVSKGDTYCGDADILGTAFDTCYEPIKDASGKVLGVYYVGYKK